MDLLFSKEHVDSVGGQLQIWDLALLTVGECPAFSVNMMRFIIEVEDTFDVVIGGKGSRLGNCPGDLLDGLFFDHREHIDMVPGQIDVQHRLAGPWVGDRAECE